MARDHVWYFLAHIRFWKKKPMGKNDIIFLFKVHCALKESDIMFQQSQFLWTGCQVGV